jgi:teichuronic acid biosynthesis glycosyltransferase TuaC
MKTIPSRHPRILVFSSLFPSAVSPNSGIFIKERLFRLGERCPLVVVSPQAWSPVDWLIRKFRSSFRLQPARFEQMGDVAIYRPRYFSFPGLFKSWDGWLMALGTRKVFAQIVENFQPDLIDAHFLFPDGNAAWRLSRISSKPLVVSVRGSKDTRLLGHQAIEKQMRSVLQGARRVICVSASLRNEVALALGARTEHCQVVGNGVDLEKFSPIDKDVARDRLGIGRDAKVLIGVGNLIELKGFHRIIPLLVELRKIHPTLIYLIVGGASSQGDNSATLKSLIEKFELETVVRLCGRVSAEQLKYYYSASDVFALATSYEGWANVFLEAMACGLPVITTRVGGNSEVVVSDELGMLVEYFDPQAYSKALDFALKKKWNRAALQTYAQQNSWASRIEVLERLYNDVLSEKVFEES